jgi:MoaA/NifB/PqqE/SkfB family radical SAM enzyme
MKEKLEQISAMIYLQFRIKVLVVNNSVVFTYEDEQFAKILEFCKDVQFSELIKNYYYKNNRMILEL